MTSFAFKPSNWLRMAIALSATVFTTSLSALDAKGAINSETAPQTETTLVNSAVSQIFDTRFCPSDLDRTINSIINRPEFGTANWGILVYPLDEERVIYAHNANNLLIPASNIKLLTTAAAIQIFAAHDPQMVFAFRDELYTINRDSNNARADDLLRNIGGQHRVQAALEPLGVRADSFIQADGSGLSRSNKVKPSALVTLLKGMYETDNTGLFYESLPTGGINGTLRNRFKETRAQGKVHAKTGTLRGVRALSGYLETDSYGTVIFSIVINQSGQSGGVMLDAIDEMVLHMSQLQDCN
ncbi:D-alanyl-D-alanine carboxypeptidase [Oscillatoria sp. CS-180]|uniref:D-alanyl-D-alanine carboxypeptidase n=1 Tax=Oscillatoria sp. CS-180 TaxID=3021720 RepID=UPI00232AE322|nr:D-alanyl-D-alanine carboxypeptidase [Oscillatoria sp. CS-180]MDB9527595.1 D-alanyl-D-alanine carboxypeptidase [Oscillatoria sp. CS-180]